MTATGRSEHANEKCDQMIEGETYDWETWGSRRERVAA
jgi:hypothetical protein